MAPHDRHRPHNSRKDRESNKHKSSNRTSYTGVESTAPSATSSNQAPEAYTENSQPATANLQRSSFYPQVTNEPNASQSDYRSSNTTSTEPYSALYNNSYSANPVPSSVSTIRDFPATNQYNTTPSSQQPDYATVSSTSLYTSQAHGSSSNSYENRYSALYSSTTASSYPAPSYPTTSYIPTSSPTQTTSYAPLSNQALFNIGCIQDTTPSQQSQESQATVSTEPTEYALSWNDISPLAKEFIEHLYGELCSSVNRELLERWIWHDCASLERTAASEALQATAASMAKEVVNGISDTLAREVKNAKSALWRAGIPFQKLETKRDFEDHVGEFAAMNLTGFYPPGNKRVREIAEEMVARKTLLPKVAPELKAGMSKLALYDIIILCDNSGSMAMEENGKRITALRDTLKRVARFATILNPDGISLRVLNDTVGDADNRKSVEEVEEAMRSVRYEKSTKLGTVLESKIIYPMITKKAKNGTLKKPVIVVIITDGEPHGERKDTLREKILGCKRTMLSYKQPPASTVFLISRVGNSAGAAEFLQELSADSKIGSMVYSSEKDLLMKNEVFQRTRDDVGYTSLLVKLFLSALQAAVTSPVP